MRNESLIEWVLRNENAIRKAVYEKREDPGTSSSGGGRSGNRISNPTQEAGIRNATELTFVAVSVGIKGGQFRLSYPERWLRMCDKVKAKYADSVYAEIIVQFYSEGKTSKEVIENIRISRASFFVLKNEIITFAEGVAIGLGLYLEK